MLEMNHITSISHAVLISGLTISETSHRNYIQGPKASAFSKLKRKWVFGAKIFPHETPSNKQKRFIWV